MPEVTVHHGDSREVLKGIADASIDSVVCDPPYALVSIGKRFGKPDAAPAKGDVYARASAGFMGQAWDTGETAFAVEFWAEVFRVLKPGGHVVAFSGTRTYHRLACAIEDAGFELRDMIAWLYGSGFPKSHDVAKGIDKAGGASPAEQARILKSRREVAGLSRDDVAERVGCTPSSVRDWEEGRARAAGAAVEFIVPSATYRAKLADLLGYTADERRVVGLSTDRRGDGTVVGLGHAGIIRKGGVTAAARQWEGWGTALKPALEPIILARKPLVGTVAENVLQHGTGALNIDGCRIHGEDAQGGSYTVKRLKPGATLDKTGGNWRPEDGGVEYHGEMKPGRWPANVVHDGSDEVVGAFPDAPGQQRPVTGAERSHRTLNAYGDFGATRDGFEPRGDVGSAARFFYTAKADKLDRLGSKHPTVKPIDLMQWLCRLVTPPGGTVLDPFAGSGTTGVAAYLEGFDAILIEREAPYVEDIHRRIAWVKGEGKLTAQEISRRKPSDNTGQNSIFGDAA